MLLYECVASIWMDAAIIAAISTSTAPSISTQLRVVFTT